MDDGTRRARILVVISAGLLASAALAVQACSDDDTATATDAGSDAAEAGQEAGPPDSATCDLGANLLERLPDASIADGASTSGICIGCVDTKCGSQVNACNKSCECQNAAYRGLNCFLQNSTNPTPCLAQFTTGVDPQVQAIGISLAACVNANCKKDCATSTFQPGADAGDAGD